MILWSSRARGIETTPAWPGARLRAWRWTLFISRSAIGLQEEVTFDLGVSWRLAIRYYCLSVTGHWAIGGHHVYYDGSHCSFSIGPVHAAWSSGRCAKCEGEG